MKQIYWLKRSALLIGCLLASCSQPPPPITTPIVLSPHQMMVQPGDTLYGIARYYGVSVKQLMAANHLTSSFIQAGRILNIPPKETVTSGLGGAPLVSDPSIEKRDLPPLAGVPGYAPLVPGGGPAGLDPSIAQEIAQEAKPELPSSPGAPCPTGPTLAPQALTGASSLTWPIKGDVVSQFSRQAGKRSDGIEIAGKPGAPVKAAVGGTVFKCVQNFNALGNVVIVKSPDGSITAYGHLDQIDPALKVGSSIQQGDVLGTVGQSGNIKKPQLYFEVRKMGKDGKTLQPVDPVRLLK